MSLPAIMAQALCGAAFAWYGVQCLQSPFMIDEFDRYGLARYRRLTGWLQLAGSAGLLAGFVLQPLLVLSSAGLAGLMLAGFIVRLRIRDPFYLAIPALAFFVLNLFILASSIGLTG